MTKMSHFDVFVRSANVSLMLIDLIFDNKWLNFLTIITGKYLILNWIFSLDKYNEQV